MGWSAESAVSSRLLRRFPARKDQTQCSQLVCNVSRGTERLPGWLPDFAAEQIGDVCPQSLFEEPPLSRSSTSPPLREGEKNQALSSLDEVVWTGDMGYRCAGTWVTLDNGELAERSEVGAGFQLRAETPQPPVPSRLSTES